MDGTSKYAFISYSTKNQASADALRHLLEDAGISTWMAPGDIPAGSKYAQVINQAVKGCSCFLLVLTEDSQSSVWVAKETERAVNYNKPIIPIRLDDVVLNDEFELYISSAQIVAVSKIDSSTPAVQTLLNAVRVYTEEGKEIPTLATEPPKEASTPQPPSHTETKRRNIFLCILLSVVTCGIYSIYWYYCLTEDTNKLGGTPATASGGKAILFTVITIGCYGWYWLYQRAKKIDRYHVQRGILESNNRMFYLIFGIVLSLVVAMVGLWYGIYPFLIGILLWDIIFYALIQNELNKIALRG